MTEAELDSDRAIWTKLLYQTGNVARYLWPSGTVVHGPSPNGDAEIREFLGKLQAADVASELLGFGYYLSLPALRSFLTNDLPELVRHLGRASTLAPPAEASSVRGRVLWSATLLGRLSGRVPRGRYVSRSSLRNVDILENQLLKRFLVDLANGVDRLSAASSSPLPQSLSTIQSEAHLALNSAYLKAVTLPKKLTPAMIAQARRARDFRYGRAARLAVQLEKLSGDQKWEAISSLLLEGWVTPITHDDLFELFCIISILDVLEIECKFGPPEEYGLIWRNRKHVARFERNGTSVMVYFNLSVNRLFSTPTRYAQFKSRHEFYNVGARRPDITMVVKDETTERRVLIECKATTDASYARDSVYKVFGYLYDFEAIWKGMDHIGPKAALLFPSKVNFQGKFDSSGDVVAASAMDRSSLHQVLRMLVDVRSGLA